MTNRPTPLFQLDRRKRASLQTQLALNLKRLVHHGVLKPGKSVPPSRELARDLQISRNTVVQAYDRLIGEGYLEAASRRGIFVSELLTVANLQSTLSADSAVRSCLPSEAPGSELKESMPFRPCQPDVRLFPLPTWNRMRARALRRHGARLLQYQSHEPLGLPALRRSLAEYLQASRAVRCDWRQIAITSGSQQALFLLAHLLLKPGDPVGMEDPGYLGARWAWQHSRADIILVPVDSAGVKLPADKEFAPKLLYVTPSRQFPVGSCLSLARRLELIAFAAKKKIWIVEDDYDSEFRYSRPPLPSLQSLDSSGRVIYIGSTSKVLFPSLRIGYVILPSLLIEKFAALRAVLDEHGPLIDQATLAEFLDGGAFYRHIRHVRPCYAERLETFTEAARHYGLPLQFPHTDGGMNLAGFFQTKADDDQCSRQLMKHGLEISSISRYSLRAKTAGLFFGFSAFEPSTIRKSMKLAARVLDSCLK